MLQETYAKLHHELGLAEEKLRKAHSQGKLLEADRKTLEKGIAKANNSIKVQCFLNMATASVPKLVVLTLHCTYPAVPLQSEHSDLF